MQNAVYRLALLPGKISHKQMRWEKRRFVIIMARMTCAEPHTQTHLHRQYLSLYLWATVDAITFIFARREINKSAYHATQIYRLSGYANRIHCAPIKTIANKTDFSILIADIINTIIWEACSVFTRLANFSHEIHFLRSSFKKNKIHLRSLESLDVSIVNVIGQNLLSTY